jgi:murein DD-endopeptidase MepM/ murein hydrolase activator NlpD
MILAIFLSSCAALEMHEPFSIDKQYGGPYPAGEYIHPGIDFGVIWGTPIIAISYGKVGNIDDIGSDGASVTVVHGYRFKSLYAHLSKVFVEKGQILERGQLIGLSGASNNYGKLNHQHLHFGIGKIGWGDMRNYSSSYDPKMFWLGGQPQCFDPKMDYSVYDQKDITLPIACGDYGKALIAESKRKN